VKTTLALLTLLSSSLAFAGGGQSGFPPVCKNGSDVRVIQHCSVSQVGSVNASLIASLSAEDQKQVNQLLQSGNSFSSLGCSAGASHGVISAPGFGNNYPVSLYDGSGNSIAVQLNSESDSRQHSPRVQDVIVTFNGSSAAVSAQVSTVSAAGGIKFQMVAVAAFSCN
jgi:hypothetical protein